ncbi:unnamed protein product [Lota lota]
MVEVTEYHHIGGRIRAERLSSRSCVVSSTLSLSRSLSLSCRLSPFALQALSTPGTRLPLTHLHHHHHHHLLSSQTWRESPRGETHKETQQTSTVSCERGSSGLWLSLAFQTLPRL